MNLSNLLVLFALSLTSCVLPIPHRQISVPSISGTIRDNGEAVVNTEFIFSLSSSKTGVCELPLATAKTDDYGQIKIYQQSELNWVFVFGDPIAEWELCLKRDGKLISLWRAHYIGVTPVQLNITCDIAKKPSTFIKLKYAGEGLCEFENHN